MVLGAGEAVAGLAQAMAQILTHEIARVEIDHTPKTKKIKGNSKLKGYISISPLTVMFAIAAKNYSDTGIWDLGLHILPGIPTISEGAEAITTFLTGKTIPGSMDTIEEYYRGHGYTEEQLRKVAMMILNREIALGDLPTFE